MVGQQLQLTIQRAFAGYLAVKEKVGGISLFLGPRKISLSFLMDKQSPPCITLSLSHPSWVSAWKLVVWAYWVLNYLIMCMHEYMSIRVVQTYVHVHECTCMHMSRILHFEGVSLLRG
eukprot:c29891_g1_i1 orf=3-353(-)